MIEKIVGAAAMGGLLGLERELRGKPAGVKTNALVALAASSAVLLTQSVEPSQVVRVMAAVIQGVGFIGGGLILKEGHGARGENYIMSKSLLGEAFVAGIISACSMPLGSLTAFFWHPRNRVLAFLMAFGGGALLAALVIDLVGSATEKGHLLELVAGTILGSLLFTAPENPDNS